MSKKLIYLVPFVLGLGLVLANVANAADPSPVGWWKFDDGSGTVARDSSGNGHDGTLVGSPQWVDGYFAGALQFSGSPDVVRVPYSAQLNPDNELTVMLWANVEPGSTGWRSPLSSRSPGYNLYAPAVDTPGSNTWEFWVGMNPGWGQARFGPAIQEGEWTHVAAVYDNASLKLYGDGELGAEGNGVMVPNTATDLQIGAGSSPDNPLHHFVGKIDDVRIYNRALTEAEIQQAMIIVPPGQASRPSPDDEVTDVPRDVVLNWTPGEYAPLINGHKVYLSENFDDVKDGIAVIGTQNANSYDPGRLNLGTTYYWRIDEANSTTGWDTGDVWSFTVEPVAYPIDSSNITATASSSFNASTGPENTINGSGLDADDLHSEQQTNMWLSNMTAQPPTWIQYEFDKAHKLHEMWVWNFNQNIEPIVGFGLKDVTIEYSVDGTDYTTLGTTHEFARAPGMTGYAHNATVDFSGVAAKYVRITANDNWGFMAQYGLSEVRFFYVPVQVREPDPDSGATDVSVDATLGFRAGRQAAKHDVYLSTDEQTVIDSTAPVTTVTEASHGPLSLDLGQTYYWRVDEVNEAETPTTWQGDIWNFTTQEYFVLEDFEAYDDYEPNRIFDTWVDGWGVATNGSTMGYSNPIFVLDEHFLETAIVHGGSQSTPLFYDNTASAVFSEATRTVDTPRDWTQAGVKALTLWFHGDPSNSVTEQMYVKINGSKVIYNGDADSITRAGWQMWYIDLAALGVNLSNVTELTVGLERSGAVGGKGVVYFDDIRLYPYDRQLVTPVEPNEANLVAHWKFDEGSGTIAYDSSGNGYDGTFVGTPEWLDGYDGYGVHFVAEGQSVLYSFAAAESWPAGTVTLWVKPDTVAQDNWSSVFSSHVPNSAGFQIDVDGTSPGSYRFLGLVLPGGTFGTVTADWVHLALTWDGTSGNLYYRGSQTASVTFTATDTTFNQFAVGINRGARNSLLGVIDEFHVYDVALTPEEIAGSAGRTTPFDKPFRSP